MKLSELKEKNTEELVTLLNAQNKEHLIEKFAALGLPHKKTEEYHYFDVEKILEKEYKTLTYPPKPIAQGEKIIITDGVVTSAPAGMRIYYEDCKKLDMEHFDPLYYLGHLLSPHTIKIEIDGDTQIEVEHHYTQSNALINYRIVLFNQANRNSTLYEHFIAEDIENTLVLYGYDMHIAQDSTLRIVKMQSMNDDQYSMIASHKINVANNANALFKSFDFGGGPKRLNCLRAMSHSLFHSLSDGSIVKSSTLVGFTIPRETLSSSYSSLSSCTVDTDNLSMCSFLSLQLFLV